MRDITDVDSLARLVAHTHELEKLERAFIQPPIVADTRTSACLCTRAVLSIDLLLRLERYYT